MGVAAGVRAPALSCSLAFTGARVFLNVTAGDEGAAAAKPRARVRLDVTTSEQPFTTASLMQLKGGRGSW